MMWVGPCSHVNFLVELIGDGVLMRIQRLETGKRLSATDRSDR